jgi:hypothetical protein
MRFARPVLRTGPQTTAEPLWRGTCRSDAQRPMVLRRRNLPSLWPRHSRDSGAPFHPSRRGQKPAAVELRDQRTVLSCLNNSAPSLLVKFSASFCLFFALALNLHSQVTVSANLTDGTGATYRTAYLHFQLLNCGDNFPAPVNLKHATAVYLIADSTGPEGPQSL